MLNDELKKYIQKHFHYNPQTGIITRDDRRNSLGSYDKDGYLILKTKGRQFKAHRIAWLLYYGTFPKFVIDHINRIKTDNRICNLRDVPHYINHENILRPRNKNTGVIGVYIDNTTRGLKKKFTTRYKGKTYRFYNLEDAIQFRKNNKLKTL